MLVFVRRLLASFVRVTDIGLPFPGPIKKAQRKKTKNLSPSAGPLLTSVVGVTRSSRTPTPWGCYQFRL